MYIYLKWGNPNTQPTTVNIYRSSGVINRLSPGTPLVTLDGSVTEYFDRTVTLGSSYYYVFEFVAGSNKVTSRNYQFTAQYQRGHGGAVVVVGDDNYGYMGYWSSGSLNQVCAQVGLLRGGQYVNTDYTLSCLKFSIKGKVYNAYTLTASQFEATSLLTFLQQDTKHPVIIDGINYLVYPANVLGAGYDFTAAPEITVPVDRDDISEKLMLPQLMALDDANRDTSTFGKVSATSIGSNANRMTGRTGKNTTRIPTYAYDVDTVIWQPIASTPNSTYVCFIFELVE